MILENWGRNINLRIHLITFMFHRYPRLQKYSTYDRNLVNNRWVAKTATCIVYDISFICDMHCI